MRRLELAQCTKDDTKLSRSKRTPTSSAFVVMLSGMHCGPVWFPEPKTGVGRVFGDEAISALTTSCTTGQSRAQSTGLNTSISPNPTSSWKQCDGRFDSVHHLAAITGEPKPLCY